VTRDISPRQRDVLVFINAFRAREQRNPLISEITRQFGWSAMKSALNHVLALERGGAIEFKGPKKLRNYRVTPAFMAVGMEETS
jgi:SOS-response transcriptional repressor LexA